MNDNHDLLNDKDVCSFEEHEAENVCSNKDAVAYRMCGEVGEGELKSEKIETQEQKALASFGIRSGVGMNLATKVWL